FKWAHGDVPAGLMCRRLIIAPPCVGCRGRGMALAHSQRSPAASPPRAARFGAPVHGWYNPGLAGAQTRPAFCISMDTTEPLEDDFGCLSPAEERTLCV